MNSIGDHFRGLGTELTQLIFEVYDRPPRTRRVVATREVRVYVVLVLEVEAEPVHAFKYVGAQRWTDRDPPATSSARFAKNHESSMLAPKDATTAFAVV